jgi:hypothetical protein
VLEEKYQTWIDEHVPNRGDAQGMCSSVSAKMAKEFPELARVRGHYHCLMTGCHPHWWLITADGKVVDPTASQFMTQGGDYEPLDESHPELIPTGKCPNCGEYAYGSNYFCSQACAASYTAYCNGFS